VGLTLIIRDTGIGIRPEDISRILMPFERARSALTAKLPGAGLGLALTKALMERHGGSISVESILDVGTTVRLSFPQERVMTAHKVYRSGADVPESGDDFDIAGDPSRARRILIVEDDPQSLKLVRDLLDGQGYETLAAENGPTAIDLARAHLPDLILMDIGLPGMSGLEAAQLLRGDERTSQIPIIAVTAFPVEGDERKVLDADCDGYIAKPITVRDFLTTIDQAGRGNVPRQRAADDFEAIHARIEQLRRECAEVGGPDRNLVQFAEAQILQGVSLLVGRVANQLNNRLTAIIGFSDALAEQYEPEKAISTEIVEVQQNAREAARLVQELSTAIFAYRNGAPLGVHETGRIEVDGSSTPFARPAPHGSARTIMLVEDDSPLRCISAKALRKSGYSVIEAENGEVALDLFRNAKQRIDVLVTDVVMPSMDGPALIEAVRKIDPKIEVIIISGYAEEPIRHRVDGDGSIRFLAKPYDLKQFVAVVDDVIRAEMH